MAEEKSKYFHRLQNVPLISLGDKLNSRFIAGENILWTFVENHAGATFPVHTHPQEQILVVLEGTEEHICGDEKFTMKAGDVCVHPPNVPHGGHTPTGFKGIDVFSPPRADYLELMRKHGLR